MPTYAFGWGYYEYEVDLGYEVDKSATTSDCCEDSNGYCAKATFKQKGGGLKLKKDSVFTPSWRWFPKNITLWNPQTPLLPKPCNPENSEWSRFSSKVANHEYGHQSDARGIINTVKPDVDSHIPSLKGEGKASDKETAETNAESDLQSKLDEALVIPKLMIDNKAKERDQRENNESGPRHVSCQCDY